MSGIDAAEMAAAYRETWTITKPSVRGRAGVVASQHRLASEIGARVLAEGGNAVDAAVTAGLAIGTVEPWMSGLGGGGFMLVWQRARGEAFAVDFGMRAPRGLDPADYPLSGGGPDEDLFGWPSVVEDRNVVGPLSFAVPGHVAGHALALERFGTRSFAEALAPAVDLARAGLPVDWYATLKIASEAPALARFEESARRYLPGGFAPAGAWGGPLPRIHLGRLAETLERLAESGPADFYRGEIAAAIVEDARAAGARLDAGDLAGYRARVVPASVRAYRGARVHVPPGLCAGPTLHDVLARVETALAPAGGAPDAAAYRAFARALAEAYAVRLETLGDTGERDAAPACTTHLSVADGEGNVVALTQTLLSVFGSKVMLPATGILMNNGVMWFDPRPGHPNSIRPGRRPLSNMCPTVVEHGGTVTALGASGGRRIMPAVAQILSFLVDYGMPLEAAVHHPRIDASGGPLTLVDRRLGPEVLAALAADGPAEAVQHGVYPALFACPNVVRHDAGRGESEGGAFVMSPWAAAVAARPGPAEPADQASHSAARRAK